MYQAKKVPLHKIIYNSLADKITSQIYKVGDTLPSEAELERIFQTSRTPVRQALKQLETDGLIYRLQGKGSFVANYKPMGQWTTMTGFMDLYNEEWEKISARILHIEYTKSAYHANLLQLREDEELIHIKRMRYYNGEPVVYLEHYLTPVLSIEIFKKDRTFISIDQLLKDEKNIDFISVKEQIEAVQVADDIADYLHIKKKSPVVKSTRVSFDQKNIPIDVTINYFSSEKWMYHIHFSKNK